MKPLLAWLTTHGVRLLPVLLLGLVGLVVWWSPARHGPGAAPILQCADLQRGCRTDLAGSSVYVALHGALKPLQPFEVRVEAAAARSVEARFHMEDMDMGFNLYVLRPVAPGVFQARVTLPVCVTGRRDWIMYLNVDGQTLAVPFFTQL